MPKLGFITYGGGHINIVLPLINYIKKNRDYEVELIALTGAKKKAQTNGLLALGFDDLITQEERQNYEIAASSIFADNYNPLSGVSKRETLSYLGANWIENIERFGLKQTESLYNKIGRHSFLPVNFFVKQLEKRRYDLIVTTNSPKSERAALIAANKLGVPSIRIEDLFFDDNLQIELMQKLGEDFFSTIGSQKAAPTKICVCSEYTKALYLTKKDNMLLDTSLKDVVVTGQPIFDRLVDHRPEGERLSFFEKIDHNKRTVLWSHQNQTADGDSVLELLSASVQEMAPSGWQLLVKFHPDVETQNIDRVKRCLLRNYTQVLFASESDDLPDIIAKVDAVMAQESTTMLEAHFLTKPTICLDPKNIRQDIPYVSTGMSERVQTSDQLLEVLDSISSGKAVNSAASNLIRLERDACKNICREIDKLLW